MTGRVKTDGWPAADTASCIVQPVFAGCAGSASRRATGTTVSGGMPEAAIFGAVVVSSVSVDFKRARLAEAELRRD